MSVDFISILSRSINELYSLPAQHLDKRSVNRLLDDLISLDLKHSFIPNNLIENFINAVCERVKPIDGFTVAKACNVMCGFLGKNVVRVNFECAQRAVSWLTRCALESPELVLVDVLQAIQKVAYGHGPDVTKSHDILLGKDGILISLIEAPLKQRSKNDPKVNSPEEIAFLSLQCMQSLTFQAEDNKNSELHPDIVQRCCDLCLRILYKEKDKNETETSYCKTIICCLSILVNLISHQTNINRNVPELLGVCRGFMVYSIQPNSQLLLQKLTPSQQTVAEMPNTTRSKGGKRPRVRKQRNSAAKTDSSPSANRLINEVIDSDRSNSYQPANSTNDSVITKNIPIWRLTSDSEISDSEAAQETKLKALQAKLRHSALMLFSVLIRVTDRREFFGYWWAFLPSSPDSANWAEEDGSQRNLAFCALKEPTSSGRAMALSVILSMVSRSRLYLSQAEMSKRAVISFTPFSVTLGYIVTCLHNVLCTILRAERTLPVLVQALKCVSAVVQATPYHRLDPALIKDTIESVKIYLSHKDCTIQVAALIAMGCIISVDPAVDAILQSVLTDSSIVLLKEKLHNNSSLFSEDDSLISDEETEDEEPALHKNLKTEDVPVLPNSWLVEVCFKNLGWRIKDGNTVKCPSSPLPVRLESLQVLSAISHHHFSPLLIHRIVTLSNVLCSVFEDCHPEITLHAAKCISCIGDAILNAGENSNCIIPVSSLLKFWIPLISGPLTNLLQSQENSPAKAVACDCIASIGEKSFESIKRNLQVLIIALLFGSCSDEDPLVRAAAVRALAICVIYTTLRQDICFVSDCGESILRTMSETVSTVRVKASWALGNLSDALVSNMSDPEAEDIDNNLLIRLFEAAINASNDNEKLKINAMRALGNLLRLVTEEHLAKQPDIKAKALTSIQRLREVAMTVSNVKIKWNACYAIGSAMKNEVLFSSLTQWQGPVFECLVKLATENRNLKVRINATVALRSPIQKDMYGSHFAFVWNGIMVAMENCNEISDFTEYKHKDNLMEQLCVTLAHLTCLLKPSDFAMIDDPLCFHGTNATSIVTRIKQRVLPETEATNKLLDAAKYVTGELEAKTDAHKRCIEILQNIFVWELD